MTSHGRITTHPARICHGQSAFSRLCYSGTMLLQLIVTASCLLTWPQGARASMPKEGYWINHTDIPSFLILAPTIIRPGQHYSAQIHCIKLPHTVNVTLLINRTSTDGTAHEVVTSSHVLFDSAGQFKQAHLKVPESWKAGSYTHELEAVASLNKAEIWSHKKRLNFDGRTLSVAIQLSSPVYSLTRPVTFRVIAFYKNLQLARVTLDSVELVDPKNVTVRRWLSQRIGASGFLEFKFKLKPVFAELNWTVRCWHRGLAYERRFQAVNMAGKVGVRLVVNVTLPRSISSAAFGVYGWLEATRSNQESAKGNATVALTLLSPLDKVKLARLVKTIPYFNGSSDFLFTSKELKVALGRSAGAANLLVEAEGTVHDWESQLTGSDKSTGFLFDSTSRLRFLGGRVRRFRPGFEFTAYVFVYRADALSIRTINQRVTLSSVCTRASSTATLPSALTTTVQLPDSGLATFRIALNKECESYQLVATLNSDVFAAAAEQRVLRRNIDNSSAQLQVTMRHAVDNSPDKYVVRADSYGLFQFHCTVYVPIIHYLLVSGSTVLSSGHLDMPPGVQSRTISIALSRDLIPVARLAAYCYDPNWHLLADSVAFRVEPAAFAPAFAKYFPPDPDRAPHQPAPSSAPHLRAIYGSNLSGRTVSVQAEGFPPGGFVVTSTVPYDLYVESGDATVLTWESITKDLAAFDTHPNQPMRITWQPDDSPLPRSVHLPAPSNGADAVQVLMDAGLMLLSDSRLMQDDMVACQSNALNNFKSNVVNMSDSQRARMRCQAVINACWKTARGDADFPCQEEDSLSELHDMPGRAPREFKMAYRHANYEDLWFWQEHYLYKNSKSLKDPTPPKWETTWVMGAAMLHPTEGLIVPAAPLVFASRQAFFATVEAPRLVKLGEQVGVRIALFNRWNYWMEVLVEQQIDSTVGSLQKKPNGAFEIIEGKRVHTLVYLKSGEFKAIQMPIVPLQLGECSVQFCFFTQVGIDCEVVKINVKAPGITNTYHTSHLLDLVSQSATLTPRLKLNAEETFVRTEERWLNFVPGSKSALIAGAADLIGSAAQHAISGVLATSEDVAGRPDGTAETAIFGLSWNAQMLHYASHTGQITQRNLLEGIAQLNPLLARLSACVGPHGGVANFHGVFAGEESSMLTAMALLALGEVADVQWTREVHVQSDLFNGMIGYLESVQDNSTGDLAGSIPDTNQLDAKFFHAYKFDKRESGGKGMQPVLERICVTALTVLAAFHKNIPSSVQPRANEVGRKALDFLLRNAESLKAEPLGLAMAAYASASHSKDQTARHLHDLLNATARLSDTGQRYWANWPVRTETSKEVDTAGRILIRPRQLWQNDAYAVQATAFAVLTQLTMEGYASAADARTLAFLAQTKNWQHGWVSTIDSVFALQAMRLLSTLDPNRGVYSILADLTPSSTSGDSNKFTMHMNFTVSNLCRPQSHRLPSRLVWGELAANANGSGHLVLQVTVKKNVDKDFLIRNPVNSDGTPLSVFALTCVPTFSGRNGSLMSMTTCARWLMTDRSLSSGLAMITYELPSGFDSTSYGLRSLIQSGKLHKELRNGWIKDNMVNLVFNRITSESDTCVTLSFNRFYPVANVTYVQACSVFEFFESNNANYSMYTTYNLHSSTICHVCGSYQCPYCPDYNRAYHASTALHGVALMALLLTQWLLQSHYSV